MKEGRLWSAHQLAVSYMSVEPNSKAGDIVRHLCNNKKCCNPAHLKIGTHLENMDDKRRAGKAAILLTEDKVREIRALHSSGVRTRDIAYKYDVSVVCINNVTARRTWSHI